jgi:hypothetical protein
VGFSLTFHASRDFLCRTSQKAIRTADDEAGGSTPVAMRWRFQSMGRMRYDGVTRQRNSPDGREEAM